MLGQGGHLVEGAPDAHPQHHRRTGVGPGQPDGVHHKLLHALHPVGGFEHRQPAHVLRPEALGHHGNGAPVSGDNTHCNRGRGVVLCVDPAQGVGHDGFSQIALCVPLADPLVDGLLKAPVDVDLLAQLHKDAGHARVLTDGQAARPGPVPVLPEQVQGPLGQGPGFGEVGPLQGAVHILGQTRVGPDAQPGHSGGDLSGRNSSHGRGLLSLGIFLYFTIKACLFQS